MALSFTRKVNMSPGQRDTGDVIDAGDVNELQEALEDISLGTVPIPLAGISGALQSGGYTNDAGQITTAAITPALEGASGAVNVLSYGADPTGVADSTAAFQAAIATNKDVTVPVGQFRVAATLSLSSTRFVGAGSERTVLVVPDGFSVSLFDLNAASNAYVGGLTIEPASGGAVTSTAYGVHIHGASTHVVIEDVVTDKMARAVQVGSGTGTADGTSSSVHLIRVQGFNSPTSFGMSIDDCDGVSLWDCSAVGNWLDGVKLRAKSMNVEIFGGNFSGNGVSWISGGGNTGDGIDAFAGGDTFLLVGGRYHGNHGNGITIKTDTLTNTDPARYGYVRNVRVIGAAAIANTVGSGITFYTMASTGDISDIPMASHAVLSDCYAEANAGDGFYINGRNVVVANPIARKNGTHGIQVYLQSRYVQISNPLVSANGQSNPGLGYHGIYLRGESMRVSGGAVIGVDGDDITSDTDFGTLTKTHVRNIYVDGNADDVEISQVFEDYNAIGQGIRTDMTSGRCIIDQSDSGTPYVTGAYGSIGSEYIQENATAGSNVVWRKVSGAPNAPLSGWRRISPVRPILTKTADYTVTEADFGALIIVSSGSSKTVSLPTAVGIAGDGLTIKQGGAGAVTIDPNGTETVNGLTTATVTGFAEIVSDGANWHVVAGAVA